MDKEEGGGEAGYKESLNEGGALKALFSTADVVYMTGLHSEKIVFQCFAGKNKVFSNF